jgi:hypothetical protein
VSSLTERAMGLNARMPSERPRDLQEVVLILVDGSEVRGVLHRAPGTRTLDYLNRQAESFVALTEAELIHNGLSEFCPFVAINKAHIVRLIEAPTND